MNEILLFLRRSWEPWIHDSLKLHKTQWLLPENPFSPHSFRPWPGFTQRSLCVGGHLHTQQHPTLLSLRPWKRSRVLSFSFPSVFSGSLRRVFLCLLFISQIACSTIYAIFVGSVIHTFLTVSNFHLLEW